MEQTAPRSVPVQYVHVDMGVYNTRYRDLNVSVVCKNDTFGLTISYHIIS